MKLTKKGEYALRAAMALASSDSEPTRTAEIAATQRIPKKFLEQILLALKAAHLVTSRAGPRGGYMLAKPADLITVGDILSAVEDPLSRHTAKTRKTQSQRSHLERLVEEIRTHIRSRLDGVTLRQLTFETLPSEEVEALMWYI